MGEEAKLAPILLWLIMVLCLVISVVKYLMGLILRLSFPGIKIRKDYSLQPTVSVLLPCYNEGRTVYNSIESISKSNYPNDRFEVIAQDDCSVDDSYEWMLKAQRDFTNISIRVGRNSFNCGKARTVCNALQHSSAEIIISIDSDCIFHPDAIRELTACFAEPGIGSVGGRVGVSNPNDNIITVIQTIVYYAAFELYKIPENMTRSVCCISGCLFAIRRTLLLELEPILRARHWFGIPVNQGEDRFLTHQALMRGYGTYINNDALCWTAVPTRLSVLFNQQLRWRSSILRDLFYTLRNLPKHVFKLHPNAIFTMVLTPLGAVIALLMVITMLTTNPLAWARPRAAGSLPRHRRCIQLGDQEIQRQRDHSASIRLRRVIAWSIASSLFITPLALFTFDSGDWGTRTKATEEAKVGTSNR